MYTDSIVDNNDPMGEYVELGWSIDGQLPLLIAIAAILGLGKGGVPGLATVATAATVATGRFCLFALCTCSKLVVVGVVFHFLELTSSSLYLLLFIYLFFDYE